ncbi:ABC transporter ATP-binding protein [Candidatus Pacearchaeota archaeon]|nr:MAG: ABC transporter ATP-binding protein [Candidatus Pacearchaeota archaeon]
MSGVKVKELTFGYDEKLVLDHLSFEVSKGEILAILGPNGSGKTTLLKCLNMLLKPKGSFFIDSFDISKFNEKEIAKFVGYVPQIHSPVFPYKVIDVVVSGRTPYLGFSTPTKKDYDYAYNVLNKLGLTHLADKPYTQLSGGQLRLVLIARALVQQPKVLLLDEPTSHLDLKNKVLVLKILREVTSENITVIMSEHDPSLASIFSDKILLMCNGKIVSYGKAKDVLNKENLAKVYGVKVEIFERNGNRYVFPIVI